MDELAKVRRVIDKRIPGATVETFFVLDATTGQNGLAQAKAFHDAVGLTGVVLTKLDSTAKGGIVFAIEHDLGVPVRFVGVGEQADDLLPFDPEALRRRAVRVAPSRDSAAADARSRTGDRYRPTAPTSANAGARNAAARSPIASPTSPPNTVPNSFAMTITTRTVALTRPSWRSETRAWRIDTSVTSNTVTAVSPISCWPTRHAIAIQRQPGRGERDQQVPDRGR